MLGSRSGPTCSTWSTWAAAPPPLGLRAVAATRTICRAPLQPLMDNLESQTYEVFEKDPIKYAQYQQAIYRCLMDRVSDAEKETNVQVVMVLGAGRGPLVNATLRAANQAERRVRIYAVEKNPNAVVTLESWQYEEWGGAGARGPAGHEGLGPPPRAPTCWCPSCWGRLGTTSWRPSAWTGPRSA
ncbi:hypothetical protein Q9966_016310 [Columba livia]|nr:hypothetical protein Q9966_016310 [Columba livia]